MFPDANINIDRHAYCLCLHVRPATIFVALINLGGSLICACFTLFFIVNNESKGVGNRYFKEEFSRVTGISVLMYLLLSLVSAMLLYGVLKSKPSYILPFFGIQFIDYLFTMPQFLASIYTHPYHSYYVAKAKEQLDHQDTHRMTYMDNTNMRSVWPNTSNSSAYTTSLMMMTLILIFKTYFLCVVWKCYRYLHMKEFILPLSIHNARYTNEPIMAPIVISQANVPPPNYEEATKLPDFKPPEYQVAMEATAASSSNPQTDTPPTTSGNQQTNIKCN